MDFTIFGSMDKIGATEKTVLQKNNHTVTLTLVKGKFVYYCTKIQKAKVYKLEEYEKVKTHFKSNGYTLRTYKNN
tara:strand:+ start:242 stop:466 length:225 start_codon:yes stop_codon:yes gene_type:complete